MSTNKTVDDVDKEVANPVADNLNEKESKTASEALIDDQLETEAVSGWVSLSPKTINRLSNNDEEDEVEAEESAILQLQQDSEEEEDDDEEEEEVSDEDSKGNEEQEDEEESCEPMGWIRAQLKILEDESKELKLELRKVKGQKFWPFTVKTHVWELLSPNARPN